MYSPSNDTAMAHLAEIGALAMFMDAARQLDANTVKNEHIYGNVWHQACYLDGRRPQDVYSLSENEPFESTTESNVGGDDFNGESWVEQGANNFIQPGNTIKNFLGRAVQYCGMSFFIGLIPIIGPMYCLRLSYQTIYRPLMSLNIGRLAMRKLRVELLKIFVLEALFGLLFPIFGSAFRVFFRSNHRSVRFAGIQILNKAKVYKSARQSTQLVLVNAAQERLSSPRIPSFVQPNPDPVESATPLSTSPNGSPDDGLQQQPPLHSSESLGTDPIETKMGIFRRLSCIGFQKCPSSPSSEDGNPDQGSRQNRGPGQGRGSRQAPESRQQAPNRGSQKNQSSQTEPELRQGSRSLQGPSLEQGLSVLQGDSLELGYSSLNDQSIQQGQSSQRGQSLRTEASATFTMDRHLVSQASNPQNRVRDERTECATQSMGQTAGLDRLPPRQRHTNRVIIHRPTVQGSTDTPFSVELTSRLSVLAVSRAKEGTSVTTGSRSTMAISSTTSIGGHQQVERQCRASSANELEHNIVTEGLYAPDSVGSLPSYTEAPPAYGSTSYPSDRGVLPYRRRPFAIVGRYDEDSQDADEESSPEDATDMQSATADRAQECHRPTSRSAVPRASPDSDDEPLGISLSRMLLADRDALQVGAALQSQPTIVMGLGMEAGPVVEPSHPVASRGNSFSTTLNPIGATGDSALFLNSQNARVYPLDHRNSSNGETGEFSPIMSDQALRNAQQIIRNQYELMRADNAQREDEARVAAATSAVAVNAAPIAAAISAPPRVSFSSHVQVLSHPPIQDRRSAPLPRNLVPPKHSTASTQSQSRSQTQQGHVSLPLRHLEHSTSRLATGALNRETERSARGVDDWLKKQYVLQQRALQRGRREN